MRLAETRVLVYAEYAMPDFWKKFSRELIGRSLAVCIGKILTTIFFAACWALGLGGPDEWVAFMIAEAPALNIPGIVRLVLLLIGSVGIYIQWHYAVREKVRNWPITFGGVIRSAFVIACFTPFILGAFIVTAKYNANVPEVEINDLRESLKTAQSKVTQQEEELNRQKSIIQNLGPRVIDRNLFLSTLGDSPKGEFQILYGAEDQDSYSVSGQVRRLLTDAGWKDMGVRAMPVAEIIKSATMIPQNARVDVTSINFDKEAPAMMSLSMGQPAEPRTLFVVVSAAISRGIGRGVTGGQDPSLRDNQVRIIIFPR